MLKVFLGFVVSVVVLLSSAYVPLMTHRAYATSAIVLITRIQAGGVGAATQEFIVIYNNSPEEVEISGWCLTNKTNAPIACFNPPSSGQAMYLPPYKHAVVVSSAFSLLISSESVSLSYTPLSQSSGSITGSSDSISLIDHTGALIDRHSWTSSISAGMQFERRGSGTPFIYEDSDMAIDWSITVSGMLPLSEIEIDTTIVDVCSNIEGVQTILPIGKETNLNGECIDQEMTPLYITEMLPNAVGGDAGQEFIEFYNPNDEPVALDNYTLFVGPQFDDSYSFPSATIQPHNYLAFTYADIPFTLLNSSSRVLLALGVDGIVVSEAPAYVDPKEGQSWALVNDEWQYTNQLTPGSENLAMYVTNTVLDVDEAPQPCAPNQYRSPETNRCRLISSGTAAATPCKDGQYRSEETNRCRNIVNDTKIITPCDEDEERNPETNRCRKLVAASIPASCKEGQERNPDTNRCRTITKMPNADYGVLGTQTKNEGSWYAWIAVGGILVLAAVYAVWEWHSEISKFARIQYVRVLRFARLRK